MLPLNPPGLNAKGESSGLILFDPCVDYSNSDKLIHKMLNAVNAERAKRGIRPLKINPTLMQISDFYACRLVDGGFFHHVDPYDGSTVDSRAAAFGYAFLRIGENLAAGQQAPAQAMADWMNSPSHRANILDPAFTEIGIAIKGGGQAGPFWVQEFGRPITEEPLPRIATPHQPVANPTSQTTAEEEPGEHSLPIHP